MLKKTLKFENLDGEKITEDFWFHLSKAELAELKLVHGDGLEGMMATLNVARDGQTIMDTFKKIIASTVGQRGSDGVSFEKDPVYVKRFMNSDAYSVLFMELLEGDNMAEFTIGVLPKDVQDEARKQRVLTAKSSDEQPAWIREDREPTKAEMASMSKEQLVEVMQRRVASKA